MRRQKRTTESALAGALQKASMSHHAAATSTAPIVVACVPYRDGMSAVVLQIVCQDGSIANTVPVCGALPLTAQRCMAFDLAMECVNIPMFTSLALALVLLLTTSLPPCRHRLPAIPLLPRTRRRWARRALYKATPRRAYTSSRVRSDTGVCRHDLLLT